MKAIPVYVYKHPLGDFTNGGISGKNSELLLVCDEGFIDIDPENPPENAVKMVHRFLFGGDVYHIEPLERPTGVGWMDGGNYAATSDSRFSRMCGGMYGAIAIHDRQESPELYNSMFD